MLPIILLIRDEEDKKFVEEVYARYKDAIFNKAKIYVKNEQDVDECVQDVVVVLIDHVEECRGWSEDHLKNFLMKCIRCIAVNKYKENMRRYANEISVNDIIRDEYGEIVEFDVPDEDEYIEQMVISEENVKRISNIIENMNPLYSDVLYFRSFMSMSNTEIAEMLNLPVNTVNQRILRAKRMLEEKGVRR